MWNHLIAAVLSLGLTLLVAVSFVPAKAVVSQDADVKGPVVDRVGVAWDQVMPRVAHASVILGNGFHKVMGFWETGYLSSGAWVFQSDGDSKTPQSFKNAGWQQREHTDVLVNGDCLADITVEGSAFVLIRGNLAAKVTVRDMSEIVIGGSILEGGSIEASGIASTFVGGDMLGTVGAYGGQNLWVEGSVKGLVHLAGLRLHVGRDFTGQFDVSDSLASARLDVDGFISQQTLIDASRRINPSFEASVGLSDVDAGFYVLDPMTKRWIVRSKASPEYIKQITTQ